MINDFIRLFSGVSLGTFASLLNIKQTGMAEVMSKHLALANGFIGLVIGGFTLVFLYFQIKKIRRDLKSKK